jgi:hypothetical protein
MNRVGSVAWVLFATALIAQAVLPGCGSTDETAANLPYQGGGAAGAEAGTAGGTAGSTSAGAAGAVTGTGGSAGEALADGGAGTSPGGSTGAAGDASADDVSFGYDAPVHDTALTQDSACAAVSASATKLPVDIIFVIDNSGSMTQEIQAVESNINANFATIIGNSGIDYRVIMVARHGSASGAQSICVKAPLSGTTCSPIPAQPVNNPPVFFHYSTEVSSHDSWCKVLNTFNTPDEFNFAPQGWSQWLRPHAVKTFVEITDDGVSCSAGGKTYNDSDTIAGGNTAGANFDTALLALSPAHFGDANHRRYIWHSIVCLAANTPAVNPWLPGDPMVAGKCSSTNCPAPGTGYQALSKLTGGMRFPLCQYGAFDVVFQEIAQGVVSSLACQFAVPIPEAGLLDPSKVALTFTPGNGPALTWGNVPSEAACAGDEWYYDDNVNPQIITLCPSACTKAKADAAGKIEVLLGCQGS